MSSRPSRPLAASKAAGETVEKAVCNDHAPNLGLVPDDVAEHYDAVAKTAIEPSTELPFVGMCVLERGTLVEVKSVMAIYASGEKGRFNIRPTQHKSLLAAGGSYLFAVCKSTPDRDILAMKIVPATIVDDLLPDWFHGGDGRSDYTQLAWSNLFSAEEVDA